MSLRTRLLVAFLSIICIPLVLFLVCYTVMSNYQMRAMERIYGIEHAEDLFSGISLQMADSLTAGAMQQIDEMVGKQPDVFLDTEYLNGLNRQLSDSYSYLIVCVDEELYYVGSDRADQELLAELASYEEVGRDSSIYIGGSIKSLIKQRILRFSDGSEGSVFLVTPVGTVFPEVRNLLYELIAAVVIILVITALLLTMWIYRSIISPIRNLKQAIQEVHDGNLDFSMEIQGDDEISQLCRGFEEMRYRLKESAEEKVQYDKESKELISNISHDLKTPITAIKGYVEGIMDGVASSPEKLNKYIRTIYNKANDMDRLIDELTFYSKIDTNKIPYTFVKINVADYFGDCVEEVGLDLEAKGIGFRYFNNAESDVMIIADVEQIRRVINNIISNSIKYLDKKRGLIIIRIRDVGDFIQIDIEDNGKGIDARDLPYIFDRFYRTDSARNSSTGGSGIGLSIVKKIVEDHGGRIWATSMLGSGTSMHLVLRKYQEVTYE